MDESRTLLYAIVEYFLGLLRITLTSGAGWFLELYSDSLNALVTYSIRGLEFTGEFIVARATEILKYLLEQSIYYVLRCTRYGSVLVIEVFLQCIEMIVIRLTTRMTRFIMSFW